MSELDRSEPVGRSLADSRRKLATILLGGALLIGIAVGIRAWWIRTAPTRAAALRQRQEAATLQQAREAVAANPKDWRAYNQLASVLMAFGRTDEALAEARRGAEAAPNDLVAWQTLANTYLSQKRFAAAEETYRQIAQKWPKDASGFEGMAVVQRHTGRFREALKSARGAVKLAGTRPEPHYVLGAVIQEIGARSPFPAGETGLLEEGRKHLLAAAKKMPDHPDLNFRLGRICLLGRRFDEALKALEAAVARDPNRTVAWVALSEARMRTGKLEGSIEAARRACQTGPLESEAQMALGRALLLKSDRAALEQATAAFGEAVRLNPTNGQARQRLGTALLRQGKLREAGAAFEAAELLDPHDPYPVQQLAQIYQRVGDTTRAAQAAKLAGTLAINERILSQLQRASSTHPENPLIHRALADRYQELGWYPQAENEYLSALEILPDDARAKTGLASVRRKQSEMRSP
jgi:tetratricopeptide (TPR) repeat protein